MFEPQDIVTLLETANEALRNELLKALPAEQRHTGLMVANALAVTQRYLQAGIAAGTVSTPMAQPPAAKHAELMARCRQELQIANPKRL